MLERAPFNMYARAMIFIITLLVTTLCQAQPFHIKFHGVTTEFHTGKSVKNTLILVEWDEGAESFVTKKNGLYNFILQKGPYYHISYVKKGYVTKVMEMDATKIPEEPDVPFFDVNLQITMVPIIDTVDMSTFDEPIGRLEYKESVRTLNWDNSFSKERKEDVAKTMKEYHKFYSGYYARSDKKSVVIADSLLVVDEDDSDKRAIEKALSSFDPSDSSSSYYSGQDVAPAQQVETISGLFFTVQVGVYSKPTKLGELYNITPLNSELMDDKRIRYTSGNFASMEEAVAYKVSIISRGVKDAFIVAYFNGKRVPLEDAIYLRGKFGNKLYQKSSK